MNRYQWLMWAFRLFFSGEVIAEVKQLVEQMNNSDVTSGEAKRDFVERCVHPMVKNVGVFLLRSLIEAVLEEVKNAKK